MTIANTYASKLAVAFVAFALLFSLVATPVANAQTNEELQAQITALLAQIAGLQGQLGGGVAATASCNATFTRDLSTGSTGADVMALQKFLNADPETRVAASGVGSAGMETQYFGALTAAAVSKFQVKYRSEVLTPGGLVNPTGYFGPSSRAKANTLCAATPGTPGTPGTPSTPSTGLEGGSGSISDADYVSGLSSEEVGEGVDDVEVAGLVIEADDGSDIELVAMNLNFSKGTANRDFDKYATEVSVWFEGEEVARYDADEFEDDDNYDKTITLDSGAIIRAGDTGEIVVAVSGVSNLDSNDATETWTVEFESVRFRDAQGAVVTDTSTGDINDSTGKTFSFEDFATAADIELKVTSGDDDINDARAIDVDDTNDTDGVEFFSFNLEAEGNSEINIDDMPVRFVATGAASPTVYEIANSFELWIDGERVDSLTVPSTATTTALLTFDNFDYTIGARDTVEVVIKGDINDLQGDFAAGDTLQVHFGESETDNSGFDAEDEEGNDLSDADKTGSTSSDAHAFFDEGINVTLVSSSATAQVDDGADDDTGVFTLVFDITAFGDTVYVDETPVATTDASPVDATTSTSFFYIVYDSGTATTDDLAHDIKYTTPTGVSDSGDNIEIQQDRTTRVTLTVTQTNDTAEDDGIYYMELVGVSFSAADDTTYEYMYTFNLDEFETSTISLN